MRAAASRPSRLRAPGAAVAAAAAPTADPARLEADGEELATVTIAGRPWRVPADADRWPLDAILSTRGLTEFGEPVVNFEPLVFALKQILGPQWEELLEFLPNRDALVEASQSIAAAAGFPADPERDISFGSLPTTLSLLLRFPDKVESDLDRFWSIDLRDRFRYDEEGRRALTLRQIHVRLQNLPAESSLAIALGRRSGAEIVLMDLFKAITGKDHPRRPLTAQEAAEARARAVEAAKARADYEKRQNRNKSRRAGAAALARHNAAQKAARSRGSDHAEAS